MTPGAPHGVEYVITCLTARGATEKKGPLRALTYAGAIIAFLIGSGFATGQEILQYFTSYGYWGGSSAPACWCWC